MKKNNGYEITDHDIETAILFLKLKEKPYSRQDAIKYLEEKAALAHMAAHKIVEDEQSGKIEPVKV